METPPDGSSATPEQSIVVREVKIQNIGGDYTDRSLTNVTNIDNRITNITNFIAGPSRDLRPYLLELEKYISKGAAHDSHERGGIDAPKCHPETRTAVQERVMSWIGSGDQDERPTAIVWLSGPAGSGKTAIAGSIADACQEKGWLAGTFFFSAFSGPPDRRSKLCLIPTLAYHLIHQKSIPGIRERILSAVAEIPSVFEKRLSDQIEILILGPLRGLSASRNGFQWPKALIIDGLDECGADTEHARGKTRPSRPSQEANQQEIISALAHACKDPAFPFRVLVVSRPDPAIREAISASSISATHLFLDEKYNPDADIALFLQAKFAEIGRRYNMPEGWLNHDLDVINVLVQRASGQFIYATTVLRFIQDGKRSPQEQLQRVLEWQIFDNAAEAFFTLDHLYLSIIETSPNPPQAMKFLLAIEMLRTELSEGWVIKGLLESSPGEIDYLLGNLTSLIDLAQGDTGRNGPSLNFYHKSLGDFLRDGNRSATLREALCSLENDSNAEAVLQRFIEDRVFQTIQYRGPQRARSTAPMAQAPTGGYFDRDLCRLLAWTISSRHAYSASDVDWWSTSLFYGSPDPKILTTQSARAIRWTYGRVHKDCRWFKCQNLCEVWRKGILKHCRESGLWQLPSRRDRLKDRFDFEFRQPEFLGDCTMTCRLRPLRDVQ